MLQEKMQVVPRWLERLLKTEFFLVCRTHEDAARSECNMFCLDCNDFGTTSDAFCFYCRSCRHIDHQVIQIRRSSYHDVVRVSEMEKVLDISGVQTYVINSARVLFLNERPQPKSPKGVSHLCEICGRSLLDPFRFCSLGCKVEGIKKNGKASFVWLEGGEELDGAGISRRRGDDKKNKGLGLGEGEGEELREKSHQDIYPLPPPNSTTIARRRKGIPRRAPFTS